MFCSACGHELTEGLHRCPACGKRTRRSRALIVVLLFLALGAVAVPATWLGINAYRVQQIKATLAEAIGRDSGYTETILKVESEASQMSFLELFQLCDTTNRSRIARSLLSRCAGCIQRSSTKSRNN